MKYLGSELSKFSQQMAYAIDHYKSPSLDKARVKNIVLCGMGGSGIAGQIIRDYFLDKIGVPVTIVSDYILPRFVNEDSLVICGSYSGETEETINTFHLAREKKAQIVCIAKGGTIQQLASQYGYTCYPAESGFQPRVALGYPMTYLMLLFGELLGQSKEAELRQIEHKMSFVEDFIKESASYAASLKGKLEHKFLIFTDPKYMAIGIRLANQIQENAKLEAFALVLPEANHNQIESHYGKLPSNYIFLNSGSHPRTNLRFHYMEELLTKQGSSVLRFPQNDGSLTALFHTIFVCDWLSLQLADQKQAISNTVPNIMDLKGFLSKN